MVEILHYKDSTRLLYQGLDLSYALLHKRYTFRQFIINASNVIFSSDLMINTNDVKFLAINFL